MQVTEQRPVPHLARRSSQQEPRTAQTRAEPAEDTRDGQNGSNPAYQSRLRPRAAAAATGRGQEQDSGHRQRRPAARAGGCLRAGLVRDASLGAPHERAGQNQQPDRPIPKLDRQSERVTPRAKGRGIWNVRCIPKSKRFEISEAGHQIQIL